MNNINGLSDKLSNRLSDIKDDLWERLLKTMERQGYANAIGQKTQERIEAIKYALLYELHTVHFGREMKFDRELGNAWKKGYNKGRLALIKKEKVPIK